MSKQIEIKKENGKVKVYLNTLTSNDSVAVDEKEVKMKKQK